jgi:hypothetical protein
MLITIPIILCLYVIAKGQSEGNIKTSIHKGGNMNNYLDNRRNVFNAKVGIDKLKIADDNQGVVADWSHPLDWTIFKTNEWQIDDNQTTYKAEHGVLREWVNRRGKEALSIEIMISSSGNMPALERLVSLAINTTMLEVPFKKAEGLGDFYLVNIYPRSKSRLWVYRNVCFDIRYDAEDGEETSFDTFALAQWLQKYAEKHLVNNISVYYPQIDRVEITPSKIHVGDTFSISLTMTGNKGVDNYVMESKIVNNLDSVSEDALTVRAKALEPGIGEVNITIIDRKTLLSVQKTVTVEVLGNK